MYSVALPLYVQIMSLLYRSKIEAHFQVHVFLSFFSLFVFHVRLNDDDTTLTRPNEGQTFEKDSTGM